MMLFNDVIYISMMLFNDVIYISMMLFNDVFNIFNDVVRESSATKYALTNAA